jgi:Domain of unknown function (DUF5615)
MKLLLDQGLPFSAAALLRDLGIDTIHVGEIEMSAAEDSHPYSYSSFTVSGFGSVAANSVTVATTPSRES